MTIVAFGIDAVLQRLRSLKPLGSLIVILLIALSVYTGMVEYFFAYRYTARIEARDFIARILADTGATHMISCMKHPELIGHESYLFMAQATKIFNCDWPQDDPQKLLSNLDATGGKVVAVLPQNFMGGELGRITFELGASNCNRQEFKGETLFIWCLVQNVG